MNEEKPAKEVEEAIIDLIRSRRDAGRKKYGLSMERGDLSISQWIMHAIEESLDHAIYLEAARRKIVEQDAEIADLRAKLAAIKQAMGHPTTKTLTVGELKTARRARPCACSMPSYKRCQCGKRSLEECVKCRRTPAEVDKLKRSFGGCCDRHCDQQACDCMEIALRVHGGGTGCSICSNPKCDDPCGKH